jgi:hypothetical protein
MKNVGSRIDGAEVCGFKCTASGNSTDAERPRLTDEFLGCLKMDPEALEKQ